MQTLSDLRSSYSAEGLAQVELCATGKRGTYGQIYRYKQGSPVEIQNATHRNLNTRSMTTPPTGLSTRNIFLQYAPHCPSIRGKKNSEHVSKILLFLLFLKLHKSENNA